ncbi:MAG: DNA polymerase I [Flavobacteriales bacterium]|nr:DNA polymerase I [Flavobacteriales bacterium]
MPEKKSLYLLDAFALIYRAYFAFIRNPITNSKGMNVSAIYGFTNTLHDLLKNKNPTHFAVVFDSSDETTQRAQEYDFYKANREKTPEDISISIPIIKEIVKAFNIPCIESPGYEADDIIGTLAKEKEKEGYQVYMVTPDKDYAQLVSENIFMYKPGRQGKPDEILGVPEIKEKWEVEDPEQVIDILGMWGDSVDNIPGIPGIGEKTAKKLIKQYGSLEGLLENTDQLKGKQKENVINFAEQGRISKMLATIILDVPHDITDKDLIIDKPNKEELTRIFQDLEFRTLGKRILGDDYTFNAPNKPGEQMDMFGSNGEDKETLVHGKNIENTEHNYKMVSSDTDIKGLIKLLSSSGSFCFDTETTGIDPLLAELVGIAFAVKASEAFYVPVPEDKKEAQVIVDQFKGVLEDPKIQKIGQNLKYDIKVLKKYGVEVRDNLFDTMLAHYLIEPERRHNMNYLAENYLGYTPVSIETLIGKKGKNQKSMRDVDPTEVTEYASEDADITLQLKDKLEPKVKKIGVDGLLKDLETPLINVLADMEYEGVALDKDFLDNYSKELGADILELKEAVFELSGAEFNLDSPKQLGAILFEQMGLTYKGAKTKTGQYSTNEETLTKLKDDHEIFAHILEYRGLTKLKSTYVDALPLLINPNTQRVHSTFNQTVAATGRLSSQNPNLQNIPIRTEKGRMVRKAFIPRNDEYILLAADYSQVELRLVAEISKDKNLTTSFLAGLDIHSATAAKVFGVSIDQVTREMRSKAKMVNFGIIYAISAFGLSQRLKIPRTEAKELIENYFLQYPNVKKYMDDTIEFAKSNGYTQTLMGRKRFFKDIDSRNHTLRSAAEREAINSPIQGSAADLIKKAMIDIHNEFNKREFKSRMTLQVHDELVFDVYKPELEEVKSVVKELMENAIPGLTVPMKVDAGIGENWLQAH